MINYLNNILNNFFNSIISNKSDTEKGLFKLFKFAIYGIVLIFIVNLLFNREGFGPWGDFFGGVLNPILTFLTFMGLLMTIVLQQKELKEARAEFSRQSEALEKQQYEMTVQTFDNKFFQMLDLFNHVRVNVKSEINFKELREKFENYIVDDLSKNEGYLTTGSRDKNSFFSNAFINMNNNYDTTFKHYFLNLFQLLKFIEDNADSLAEAKEYTNIIRAQLSKNELVLLLYNAIGVQYFTTNDYQILLEKYEFFEHLRYADLAINKKVNIIFDCIAIQYKDKVFGNNDDILKELKHAKDRCK